MKRSGAEFWLITIELVVAIIAMLGTIGWVAGLI